MNRALTSTTSVAHRAGAATVGYLHPAYAESLADIGTPRALPRSGGWILVRDLPGSPRRDAMGCYPLFACKDWTGIKTDLAEACSDLISVTIVTDPFGAYDLTLLRESFNGVVRPFKTHFVCDLNGWSERSLSPHHRRNVGRALRHVTVECLSHPRDAADEWIGLYRGLTIRHRITDLRAFSPRSLRRQLDVSGMRLFRARDGHGTTVGAMLFFIAGNVAYYHLGASTDAGYACRASYALTWTAMLTLMAEGLAWVDLGAVPGTADAHPDARDGLTRFKRGWSSGTRPAYLCGHIVDHVWYARLATEVGPQTPYFPAYRSGEFQ